MTFKVHSETIEQADFDITLDAIIAFEFSDTHVSELQIQLLSELALDSSDLDAFVARLSALAINESYTYTFESETCVLDSDNYVEESFTYVLTRVI